jgi:hypothetical protein
MITSCIPNQATVDFLSGVHEESDTYKLALFTDTAAIDETTSTYSTTGESSGTGYPAGGWALSGTDFALQTDHATITFAALTKTGLTLATDGFVIYNSSKSNKIIFVQRFDTAPVALSSQNLRITLADIIDLVKA